MEFLSGKIPTILEKNSGKISFYLMHRFYANNLSKVTLSLKPKLTNQNFCIFIP
jgi:hypothetical protein